MGVGWNSIRPPFRLDIYLAGSSRAWFGWAAWDASSPLDHAISDLNIVVKPGGLIQHGLI